MGKYKYKVVNIDEGSCTVRPFSKFYLMYKRGDHVKAIKGSLGIMVFPTKKRANNFKDKMWGGRKTTKVKKVIPIGNPTHPTMIAQNAINISAFNKMTAKERRLDNRNCMTAPMYTVCYPEVIVVD